MTLKEKLNHNFVLQKDDLKGKLLSRSLLWMGLGLAVIVLIAFLSFRIESVNNLLLQIADNTGFFTSMIINFGVVIGIFFAIRNPNTHIIVPVILYIVFAAYQGLFINIALNFQNIRNFADLLLIMLIPAGIFFIMGVISFFNLFDFTKLMPLATIGMFAILIMSIVLGFVQSGSNDKWFLILAAAIFIIWIGIDIQMIKNAQDSIEAFGMAQNSKELNRIAFIFGFRLFIDFINLLFLLLRLMGNNR